MKKLLILVALAGAQMHGAAGGVTRASQGQESLTQLVKRLANQFKESVHNVDAFNATLNEAIRGEKGRLSALAVKADEIPKGTTPPATLQPARDIMDIVISHHFAVANGDDQAAIAQMQRDIKDNPAYLGILIQAAANIPKWSQVYQPQAQLILQKAGLTEK